MNKMILKAALLLAAALALPMSANAVLLGRDINGGAVAGSDASAVFLYDTVLDVTWLRDANANGAMTWDNANAWAEQLVVGAYDDWRLPTMIANPNDTFSFLGTDYGYNVRTTSGGTLYSEMASLWGDTLGNKSYCNPVGSSISFCDGPQAGWGLTNTGDFQGLQSYVYWSGLEYAPNTYGAWTFVTEGGAQSWNVKPDRMYAMAVRDSDVLVSAVPEPATYAFMLAGLALVGTAAKRKASRTQ